MINFKNLNCIVKENIKTQIRHISASAQSLAQANGFGFSKTQARPKAVSGQRLGPAWPGFFWPGLAWLLASGQSRHITSNIFLLELFVRFDEMLEKNRKFNWVYKYVVMGAFS